MENRRREIQMEMDKIKRQIEDARHQIRGREYVWPRQMAGYKRLKKDLGEKLRVLGEELVNE